MFKNFIYNENYVKIQMPKLTRVEFDYLILSSFKYIVLNEYVVFSNQNSLNFIKIYY